MNIFILDEDIQKSAEYHCDKHCVKMILEYCQLLCSSLIVNTNLRKNILIQDKNITNSNKYIIQNKIIDNNYINNNKLIQINNEYTIPYKATHQKHPCTIWTSKNIDNYSWLCAHAYFLHKEYQHRYNKTHLSYTKMIENNIINNFFIEKGLQLNITKLNPPLAMPDSCKIIFDKKYLVIESYRKYYTEHKNHILNYTKRLKPNWITSFIL